MIFDDRRQRALIANSSEDLVIAPLGAAQRVPQMVERQIPGVRFCNVRSCRRLQLRGHWVAVMDGRTRHDTEGKVQGKEGKKRAQWDGAKPCNLSLISASRASRCKSKPTRRKPFGLLWVSLGAHGGLAEWGPRERLFITAGPYLCRYCM